MPEMPLRAEPTAIRLHRAVDMAAGTQSLPRLVAGQIDGLRLTGAIAHRQAAVDEEAVVGDGHDVIVSVGRDSFDVAKP